VPQTLLNALIIAFSRSARTNCLSFAFSAFWRIWWLVRGILHCLPGLSKRGLSFCAHVSCSSLPVFLCTGASVASIPPLATVFAVFFSASVGWRKPQGEIPGRTARREPDRGLLFNAQRCRFVRGIYIGLGVWVTPPVTLVGVPVASTQEILNVHYTLLSAKFSWSNSLRSGFQVSRDKICATFNVPRGAPASLNNGEQSLDFTWDRLREPNGRFTLCTAHSMPSNNAKRLLSYCFAVAEHL
jgi:hypothetical protein